MSKDEKRLKEFKKFPKDYTPHKLECFLASLGVVLMPRKAGSHITFKVQVTGEEIYTSIPHGKTINPIYLKEIEAQLVKIGLISGDTEK